MRAEVPAVFRTAPRGLDAWIHANGILSLEGAGVICTLPAVAYDWNQADELLSSANNWKEHYDASNSAI
jgi:hypothetical protein